MQQSISRCDILLKTPSRAFDCPQRYIQGPGEFNKVFEYGKEYGNSFFFIIDKGVYEMVTGLLEKIDSNLEYYCTPFSAESCMEEVFRLSEIISEKQCDVIVGVGGGKVLDTVKLVSDEVDKPRIILPTSASNDAPAANWAAIYTPEGVHITGRRTRRSTELVLVDSEIIARAPARLFSAGIGDALATWFEAQACENSYTPNCVASGYRRSRAGMAVCKECFEILMQDGSKALKAVKAHVTTEAVENVIEANVLLSGLGFINGGLAASHGLHAGFSEIPGGAEYMHGEKVAFGLLCELVLENAPAEELDKMLEFLYDVDLPVTLGQIGIELSEENLHIIVDHTLNKNILIHHEPFAVNESIIRSAIIAADNLGKEFLEKKKS